jgi:hypothetical protein
MFRFDPISSIYLLLLGATIAENSSLLAVDRLSEVELARFPKYRALWLSKRGPTAFDYGRMMAEPASAPEYSVSVYSQPLEAGKVKYFVTYVIADRSLWDSSDVGKRPEGAEAAKTRRIDCEIPREIAEKVRQAWLGMLSGKQRPISPSVNEVAPAMREEWRGHYGWSLKMPSIISARGVTRAARQ